MKKKILLFMLPCLAALTSCEDYLDRDVETALNEDIAFSSYENATYVAYSVYGDLPQGLSEIGGSAMMAAATDEAEFTIQTHSVQKFNTGSWLPTDMPDNPLNRYYASIRKVYNFLEHADYINYDDVRDNPSTPGAYEARLEDVRQLKNEVLLLRAFYMFELIKRYGGVPIVKEKLKLDVDYKTLKRNTLEECVNEIIHWCDETAKVLPVKQPDAELGRLTKGVAKALKSQVLLFAASELWNNSSWAGGYAHPELISLPAGDRNARWKAAADAAKAVIDMAGEAGYELDTYANLFGTTAYKSKEIIFCRRDDKKNDFEKVNLPISYDLVTGGNCPSQNLVDAFQVKDDTKAVDFDWSNPAHAGNPYANRDSRLNTFVVLNDTWFKERNVEAWAGGRDGAGVRNATPTGYYIKKFIYAYNDLTKDQKSVHTWIYTRLAEIYLNYIEALNEYKPGDSDIKKYYDLIRSRAGMPGLPADLSQDEVRKLIRQERFVELCFEGKRWFDLRRWMDEETLKQPLRKVDITKKATGGFTYVAGKLEDRVFEKKMYFYPIPQSELNKLPDWDQNPLW
ncbi:RagB/SusD family nutrient uptake outer membrane protein [Bacteroides xylanisolvens]|uniref:RagB/SusD family nutrient uptake outer membrane protein n=1 Tax=Bacteroides xylanisolvens TaxID=371601 RepID=UPI001897D5A8|nr:RagB/SusD family nutrient uptake outer membrane protein [Bacteroides xylanisolvens]